MRRKAWLWPLTAAMLVGATLVSGPGVGSAQPPVWTALDDFAGDGTGDGELSFPIGLTVDSKGNVWTAENGGGETRRVQKFSPHGEHLLTIEQFGDGDFVIPHALDADDDGNVWVGDAGNGRLLQLDQDGEKTGLAFSQFGTRSRDFSEGCPCGVAVAPAHDLLFGSNGPDGRVLVFNTAANRFVRDFDAGSNAGHLAADSAGNVIVVDGEDGVIRRFTRTGRLLQTIDMIGTGPGARPFPGLQGIDTDADDRLFFMMGSEIVVFDSAGNVVAGSEFDGGATPYGGLGRDITTDGFGNVYTVEGSPGERSMVRRLMFGPALPTCKRQTATILGTLGNDRGADKLVGTAADDVIVALAGHDVVRAGKGDDTVCGGEGNDRLFGGPGGDKLDGAIGDDMLNGGPGMDILTGGGGDDELQGRGGDDVLKGNGGDDVLKGGDGDDVMRGHNGGDRLNGGAGTGDVARGGRGDDTCLNSETSSSC